MPETPLELQILGRTLLHAALVGAAAGLVGFLFPLLVEACQSLLLEGAAGYIPLRTAGEHALRLPWSAPFRPWLLCLIPALGALLSGWLSARFAPQTAGGGGDALIEAFHQKGQIPSRVIWVKTLTSTATLGTGGAGGREGPTMQIGGAIGSLIARILGVSPREQRLLLVVGVAAGISAVFRTPLGAALLAVEVLYRDDFEADALIPAVLGSVVSYSVVLALLGVSGLGDQATLLRVTDRYPFIPAHLPLYGLLAVLVAWLAAGFVRTLQSVRDLSARLPGPIWLRPAAGGLALGVLCTIVLTVVSRSLGTPGQGLGLLGGGYGMAQVAISGADWLPQGWGGVYILLLLAVAKLVASSLTVGSGGSAGDFAPSMVLGGLAGGAFGRAAQLILEDPRIHPGAFALVGMGAFYGGIAHVPLSALVLVCELAGSYDLLVPLMLAEGMAFVALRGRSLYHAQLPSRRDSPAHRDRFVRDILGAVPVREVMVTERPYAHLTTRSTAAEMVRTLGDSTWQDCFPVLEEGVLVGLVTAEGLRVLSTNQGMLPWTIAADVMQPAVTVREDSDLRTAVELMINQQLRELPVCDAAGKIVGFLDESEVARAYLTATRGSS